MTGERTLPVLEAAHIKPFKMKGEHKISDGLLLRRDLHTLLDQGYITVTPDSDVRRVSAKIYYSIDRTPLKVLPRDHSDYPDRNILEWHNDEVFLN